MGRLEESQAAGVGGVLRDHKGDLLLMFSKNVGIKKSNDTEVLAVLEILRLFYSSFCDILLVESDSIAISWISSHEGPWRLRFLFCGNQVCLHKVISSYV